MSQPLVSILIPSFNAARWLAQTLESALAQSWRQIEIIVIDDGSTDDSLRIARGFESRGVTVASQRNSGASAARNHGLRLARGDFVQFLDADDLLSPDKIAAQVARLSSDEIHAICSCRWGRFSGDPSRAEFVDDVIFRNFEPVEFLIQHTAHGRMIHPGAWLAPRKILDRAGPWDERLTLNDDGEYFARVVLASGGIAFSPTGTSLYRSEVAGSLSKRRNRRALESLMLSVELIAGHLNAAEDSPRVRRGLADYWQRLAYELYPDALDLHRQAARHVREYGGSRLRPEMGTRECLVAAIAGWKLARRLRRFLP